MDVIRIPYPLQAMMDQLFENNLLKSWGVFPNKYGQLVLNIKFDICELGQSSKHVPVCAFRRISDKQLARNANRRINNNKRRKLDPSTPMDDTDTYKFSEPAYPTPENPRVSSLLETPDVIDSPILQVEEDTLTNSVKGEMKMNMECDSVFKCYSPDISSPLNSDFRYFQS